MNIILHCFKYGREEAEELEKICSNVYYYKRFTGFKYQLSKKPYIVASRSNKKLLLNLTLDDSPILFEGLHSTYFINNKALKNRIKIVRAHNIEHEYYSNLALIEQSDYKKIFFKREAKKLRKYESVLEKVNYILAISRNDTIYFNRKYGKTINVSAFHPNSEITIKTGKGEYALYHGNLSVPENIYAAEFLVNNVFNKIDFPLIIAGKNPSEYLIREINKFEHIAFRSNLTDNEINSLIRNAHINILPTFQKTGLKLKLLSSLYQGRHCIVNENMVENTGLEDLCIVRNNAQDMIDAILELKHETFNSEHVKHRKKVLEAFSNKTNAEKIIDECL